MTVMHVLPDLLDNVECALAECLPDGIEEDKYDVAQLGQPQYCFIHIEGIAERDF
jgi:hypothetical protein